MLTITLAEFQANPDGVVTHARNGEPVVVTDNGRPLMRVVPLEEATVPTEAPTNATDPLYTIHELSALWDPQPGETPLNHDDIDKIVYGYGDAT
ncbi:MAG: type II toxin-antitoxin system Phd/YefM family antitoxin [Lacipirellulaceae bacterium]